MQEYIDSSNQVRDDENFIDFIKKSQWEEKIEIEVKLHFYAKWLPYYKIEGFIKDTLLEYDSLKKDINNRLKDTKIRPHIINKLKKTSIHLNEITKDIWDIRVSLRKKEDLDALYKRAIDYHSIFTLYRKELLK
jgi:hypothetical protein